MLNFLKIIASAALYPTEPTDPLPPSTEPAAVKKSNYPAFQTPKPTDPPDNRPPVASRPKILVVRLHLQSWDPPQVAQPKKNHALNNSNSNSAVCSKCSRSISKTATSICPGQPRENSFLPSRPARNKLTSGRVGDVRSVPPPIVQTAVTRLLVTTKQLLESLTNWSKGAISEKDMRDIVIQLGNDSNLVVAAFQLNGTVMSDLKSVFSNLQAILEGRLAEGASPENLELHLPKVRSIINNMLHGLRAKQHEYRVKKASRRPTSAPAPNLPREKPKQVIRTYSSVGIQTGINRHY